MESLKDLLTASIARHKIATQVKAATVCSTWRQAAVEVLPKEVAGEAEVISFRNGTLKVAVPGPSFSQAVKIAEIPLLEEINKQLGKNIVERIVPRVA